MRSSSTRLGDGRASYGSAELAFRRGKLCSLHGLRLLLLRLQKHQLRVRSLLHAWRRSVRPHGKPFDGEGVETERDAAFAREGPSSRRRGRQTATSASYPRRRRRGRRVVALRRKDIASPRPVAGGLLMVFALVRTEPGAVRAARADGSQAAVLMLRMLLVLLRVRGIRATENHL